MISNWVANEFRRLLADGVVQFRYQKTNGSYRTALGTTSCDIVPQDKKIKGYDPFNPSPTPDKTILYYDLQIADFRSMSLDTEFIVLSSNKI